MITFGNNFITVTCWWTAFKSYVESKYLSIQYEEDAVIYRVFAIDDSIVYLAYIWKGTVPEGVIYEGYTQEQNDLDKTDFETNYKANANQRITPKTDNGIPFSVPKNYLYEISGNKVSGCHIWSKEYIAAFGNVGRYEMNLGIFNEMTSGAQRSFKSTNANDTAAGTGIRKIQLSYISSIDGLQKTEVITLNGTSAVASVATDILYINEVKAISVGSLKKAAGTISLYNAADGTGTVMVQILPNYLKSYISKYYVPAGKLLYIVEINVSVDDMGVFDLMRNKDYTSVGGDIVEELCFTKFFTKNFSQSISVPITVSASRSINVYYTPDKASGKITCYCHGWLEDLQ
jgi:hypothetical protein